ncbi:MAG: hypothetical protein ACJ79R_13985 [Anaeromyxobacteraceae bacterium]
MTDPQALDALRTATIGRAVSDRQLTGSALALWLDTRPDENVGFVVALGPTWQVRGPAGVVAGSRQAADEENLSGWAAVPAALEALRGRAVESVEVDPASGELTLALTGGFGVRTFTDDPRDRGGWKVKDLATGAEHACAPARSP